MQDKLNDFYIVARELGAEHSSIPTWANETPNTLKLDENHSEEISRVEVDGVRGAFQLLNVLSTQECKNLVNATEELGYLPDAAVSLPRSVRHNDSLTWVVDDSTHEVIWKRCLAFMVDDKNLFQGKKALGVNQRFRFYKYSKGDYFSLHTDGSWPGSRVSERKLITDYYGDRYSQMTFLLFLSDGYEGGATEFLVDSKSQKLVKVKTPIGGVLCFPHGTHPMHCLHSSEIISSGVKYIMRSDVLYEK